MGPGCGPAQHRDVRGDQQHGDAAVEDHEGVGVGGAAQKGGAGHRQRQLRRDRQLPQPAQLTWREREEQEDPGEELESDHPPGLDRLAHPASESVATALMAATIAPTAQMDNSDAPRRSRHAGGSYTVSVEDDVMSPGTRDSIGLLLSSLVRRPRMSDASASALGLPDAEEVALAVTEPDGPLADTYVGGGRRTSAACSS